MNRMKKTKRINNFSELDLVSIVRAFQGITHDGYWGVGESSSQMLGGGVKCTLTPFMLLIPLSIVCYLSKLSSEGITEL